MPECELCFVDTEKRDLKGYTLVEGFPGMGLVGTISAKYLIEKIEFREVGHIECGEFVPVVRIHKGIPVHPARMYVNDQYKLAVLIAEQVISSKVSDVLAKRVVEWVKLKNIKRVISIAGIKNEDEKSTEQLYGIASNGDSLKELQKFGITPIEDGLTTGVTALILLELQKEKGIIAYSLLGNVNLTTDYKTAGNLIQALNTILGLNIDVKPLMEEAQKIEQSVKQQIQEVQETHEKAEKMGGLGPSMYA